MNLSFIPTSRRQTRRVQNNSKEHETKPKEDVLSPNSDIPIAASHPEDEGFHSFEEQGGSKGELESQVYPTLHGQYNGELDSWNSNFRVQERIGASDHSNNLDHQNKNNHRNTNTNNNNVNNKTARVRIVNEKISMGVSNKEGMSKESTELPLESSSILLLHPSLPPVPAEHPSRSLHQRSHSTSSSLFSNPLVQNIPDTSQSVNAIMKLTKRITKRDGLESNGHKMVDTDGLDRGRVLDPRSRAILDLEPVVDSRQLRVLSSHHHHKQNANSHRIHLKLSEPIPTKSVLAEPLENSTRFIQKQMNLVQSKEFDSVDAIQTVSSNPYKLKNIQDKVTIKGINIKKSVEQFVDLVPIRIKSCDQSLENTIGVTSGLVVGGLVTASKPRAIPRAKKSTSQAWLDTLECKPDLEDFRSTRLEVDTICLPFPQIPDNPLAQGALLSSSCIDINFKDSRRWNIYDEPVTCKDL